MRLLKMYIFFSLSTFVTLIGLLVTSVHAAESVDQAVTQIAEKFVESRSAEEPSTIVAITSFMQSDRRNTQFADLVLIALTGKMVQYGRNKFKVVEKAQLDEALREIQIGTVPIFDPDTVQKLGKILRAETLIVGEITSLSDQVRIDARLIEIETILTIEQASVWVPLTPTVQRQIATTTVRTRSSIGNDNEVDRRNGIWSGTGSCGETQFGIAVSVVVNPDNSLSAMQTYYPLGGDNANLEAGVLAMEGTIDPEVGEFTLSPDSWLYQPVGHQAMGFSGILDGEAGTIQAQYKQEGCGTLILRKRER